MVKLLRCGWCGDDPLYVEYHDREWGVPERGRQPLFERLTLEGMQAGLSWLVVLRKRAHMTATFRQFDPDVLARVRPPTIERWLQDPGIIRHRGKLEAMLSNARLYNELEDPGAYLWQFAAPSKNRWRSLRNVPNTTPESEAMSKALKRLGFKFVGPTICYAFMQSAGMVNDHVATCHRHKPCADLAARSARRTNA